MKVVSKHFKMEVI